MKRWEKRRYFVTEWEPGPPGQFDHLGALKIDHSLSLPACTIYGYEDDSEDERDHFHIDSGMRRGLIFGRWFSTNCVNGEWGHHHISDLTDITADNFESARQRNWDNI